MAFGPVNAGSGVSKKTTDEINEKIRQTKLTADSAAKEIADHKTANNPHSITVQGIGAAASRHTHVANDLSGVVPITRKVNNKALSGDINLTASDVGAATTEHTHNFADLSGAVFQAGASAPANKGLLWIDTNATTGGLKYYNGSAWVHVPVATT